MEMDQTKHQPYGIYEKYIKRVLDVFLSIAVLLLFWWLYVLLALLVRIKLGAPVLFTQPRVGKDEKIFQLYKFRSMTNEKDENGELLPNEERTTKFGKRIRSMSLDELPELFNILKGDMSFIGPRPLLVDYLPYYTSKERHRHDVLPGLTGLAQVNGRNYLKWEDRFAYDLQYVSHITFSMDCKIVLVTFKKVFKRQDILELDNQSQMKTVSFQRLDVERAHIIVNTK